MVGNDDVIDYNLDDQELDLPEQIEKKILSQTKDFTIREFKTMVDEGDIVLKPDYQRNFVYDIKLSSKLIESVLMEVPIPVIYLAEEENGTYSVIDGQQRLTSFISFLNGTLPSGEYFSLKGLTVLRELNNKKFSELNKVQQSKIKKTTIHTIIIKKESQDDIKFDIFERLNTGSVKLNEDEIRNTIYRGNYIKLLAELEDNINFNKMVNRPNSKKRMGYRGMILRFFALSEKTYINYKPGMKQFCNIELRDNKDMSEDKQEEYRRKFNKAVDLTYSVFGENAFKKFNLGDDEDPNGGWHNANLNLSLFDVQLCGFVHYEKSQVIPKADAIREAMLQLITKDEVFKDAILIATNDKVKVKRRFQIWFSVLEGIIGDNAIEKRFFPYSMKKEMFDYDSTCQICKQQIIHIDDAEMDHIVPYSKGGLTTRENAQLTHRYCNRKKRDII